MSTFSVFAAVLVSVLSMVAGCGPGSSSSFGEGDLPKEGGGWVTEPSTYSTGTGTPTGTQPSAQSGNGSVALTGEKQKWYEVDQSLGAWTPMLVDEVGDAADGNSAHDIKHVVLVLTKNHVLVRYQLGADPAPTHHRDLRFWFEQQNRFLTVETKSASRKNDCTISEPDGASPIQIESCFNATGEIIDIAIPRDKIPKSLDLDSEFWISGPQVCCSDQARTQPIDKVDASQGVWRKPEPMLSSTTRPATPGPPPAAPGAQKTGQPAETGPTGTASEPPAAAGSTHPPG